MKPAVFIILIVLLFHGFADGKEVIAVVGLEGQEEYTDVFSRSLEKWREACKKAEVEFSAIDDASKPSPKEALKNRLSEVGSGEVWLVLIGHGSFDGREAKFNVAGEDFTARELGEWSDSITGNMVVINTSSSSAPFLRFLSGENRTVITATKSANEIYFTRFGEYFAEAITGVSVADLDNDDQVSVLESFLYASGQVAEFYEREGRLATEHALIDDNGDGLGTRAEWFEGTTATRVAKDGAEPDGLRAMQQVLVMNEMEKSFPPELRGRRDELERSVRLLRRNRRELEESVYYAQLEKLLRELAQIYREVENQSKPVDPFGGGGGIGGGEDP